MAPESLTLVRHAESAYNNLRKLKAENPRYRIFKQILSEFGPAHERTRSIAEEIVAEGKLILPYSDKDTPLTDGGKSQAEQVGRELKTKISVPDFVVITPTVRTRDTLRYLQQGWADLEHVEITEEERLREREHGLYDLYNDADLFLAMHPDQAELKSRLGSYMYRYPQGESIPDVRLRVGNWYDTFTPLHQDQNILVICHNNSILALRAHIEGFDAETFERLKKHARPVNAGVTTYRKGKQGSLQLASYNTQYY